LEREKRRFIRQSFNAIAQIFSDEKSRLEIRSIIRPWSSRLSAGKNIQKGDVLIAVTRRKGGFQIKNREAYFVGPPPLGQ